MEPNDFTAADAMADAGSSDDRSMRARIRGFIARHIVPWEVTFAVLALIWVALDFGFENATGQTATWVFVATVALNIIFAIEFFGRLWAAIDRRRHLRNHVVDAVALVPPFRILRLLRLFRLVRVFSGVYRAGMRWGPLAEHRGFLSLVVAWVVLGVPLLGRVLRRGGWRERRASATRWMPSGGASARSPPSAATSSRSPRRVASPRCC